jgi:predicted metal-dependent phosphoesterase TrpH
MLIDLHTHTTCSDGTDTPEDLVSRAAMVGVSALAITDHDTVSGLERAKKAAESFSDLKIFSGIEISAAENGQLHILGYGIDPENEALQDYIQKNNQFRMERKGKIVDYLQEKGVSITLEEVAFYNDGKTSGKPHFAKALEKKGITASVAEAFQLYFDTDEFREKVERPKPSGVACVRLILGAGGVPVLAHPAKLKLEKSAFLALLQTLIDAGLQGIEAYYSTHTAEEMAWYCKLAEEKGLICTCGSDFHGEAIKKNIEIGTGIAKNLCLPDVVERSILRNFQKALEK